MSYERTSISRQQERIFKIIVIGDTSVGKTCLSCRFCDGKFPKSEATIGVDFREKVVKVDNENIKLQLWDTAGQERFRLGIVSHYYRKAHAVVFVYDVTSMETFKNLTRWLDEFKENHKNDSDVAKILVGNKCDRSTQKAVSTSMAQKFADMHNMPLFETSAADEKEGDTINAIFMTLAHKLKNQKPLMLPSLRENNVIVASASYTSKTPQSETSWWCC